MGIELESFEVKITQREMMAVGVMQTVTFIEMSGIDANTGKRETESIGLLPYALDKFVAAMDRFRERQNKKVERERKL